MGQVKEQVEAFDERGGHRHGRHAVHSFLLRGREKGITFYFPTWFRNTGLYSGYTHNVPAFICHFIKVELIQHISLYLK